MSTVHVKYVGPHDEVEVLDGQIIKTVARGDQLEVSHDLAHGHAQQGDPTLQPGDDGFVEAYEPASSGLLDQDVWELVKPKRAAEAAADPQESDQ